MTSVLSEGQAVGEFEILEVAGIGGMGVVYRAKQRSLDRVVALKVIREEIAQTSEYRERFMREAHVAASVDHPHIVSVFDVGDYGGRLALAMQWVRGQDLRTILGTSGSLHPQRAVPVLCQLGGALDAVHSAGLVHRDVKPSNVLVRDVGGSDHAYLTDFGVAKRSDTVADLTATGVVVGTVDYMAPEQITGGRTDARTDIYALGCVFFEMLTGRIPYERENSVAKLFAHVSDPPPRLEGPLAEIYPAFTPVLEKAMAKNPADRYMSGADFARDATAALRGMRYTAPPTVVATGDANIEKGPPTLPDPARLEALRATRANTAVPPGIGAVPPVAADQAGAPGQATAWQSQPAPATVPQAHGPAAPTQPPGAQMPPGQPAAYQGYPAQPPGYYGYGPPPAPTSPARSRGVSPLALILLAVVAAAGVAAGVLAALGLFSHKSSSPPTPKPQPAVTWKPCGGDLSVGPNTSCAFARNVESAYRRSSGGNRSVTAFSPVTKATYTMHCTGGSPHICRGGNNAAVRFNSGPTPAPTTGAGYPVRPCDPNISANAVTTCPFAENTFKAYAGAYKRNGRAGNQTVAAYSAAAGRSFTMRCTSDGSRVTCLGGNHAFVTFPLHAVQVY